MDLKDTLVAMNKAFDEFKTENDTRLKQIEENGKADPLLEAKVDKLNDTIADYESKLRDRVDEVEDKLNIMKATAGNNGVNKDITEHAKLYNKFVRRGMEDGLRDLEIKNALSTGSDSDGGYAVPVELDRNIGSLLTEFSAMRRMANVMSAGPGYEKLFNIGGTASGWVGETSVRPETATSKLAKLTPFYGEIYANPAATQQSLDDIFFAVESWIVSEVSKEFAIQESAFLTGDGINKPKGLLSYPNALTADGVRPFGTIQAIASGDAAGFPAVSATYSPFDALIDITTSIKTGHRNGAQWMLNKSTLGYFRKLKSTLSGEYLLTLPTEKTPGTILGYSYEEDENMPDIGAGSLPIIFGNLKRAYTIIDVMGTRMMRDPYTNKPYVQFYTTKRVGGFLEDSESVKLIVIQA